MVRRRRVRGAVAVAAAVTVGVVGTAAVAAATGGSAPTGLCLSGTGPVVTASPDGSGGFTCASGRTLAVLASDADARSLREGLGQVFERTSALGDSVIELRGQVDQQGGELLGLADRVSGTEGGLQGVADELAAAQQALDRARADLTATRAELAAVQRSSATSVKSVAVPFAGSPVRTTVSCDGGRALSGSVRTTSARVLQSAVADDGLGWAFEVEPSGRTPSATLLVVCAGRSTSPGGPATPAPPTAAPGPTAEPAPGPGTP